MTSTDSVWNLLWSDEFEGDAIDRTNWAFDTGNGFHEARTGTWIPGWGNHELQYYTPEPANAFVRDSVLHLRALRENRHGCAFTSARLASRDTNGTTLFATRYGKFEIRARAPLGQGLWPALWLLPAADTYGGWAASGEIDVMEARGDEPGSVSGALHFGSCFPHNTVRAHPLVLPGDTTIADWHVYGLEWEPGRMRWSVDGIVGAREDFWWSCSRMQDGQGALPAGLQDLNPWPAPFDQPFYLVMNLAVGGDFPGPPGPATHFPADFEVDYVRVYERAGGYPPPAARGPGPLPPLRSADD